MWRAFFFAVGIMLIITGLECLVTQQFVIHGAQVPNFVAAMLFDEPTDTNITPPDDGMPMAQSGYSGDRQQRGTRDSVLRVSMTHIRPRIISVSKTETNDQILVLLALANAVRKMHRWQSRR